jgi:hypothetical protein
MMLVCEHCGKDGSLDGHVYSGKRVRLRCPYCAAVFIYAVPLNGSQLEATPSVVTVAGAAAASADETRLGSEESLAHPSPDMTVMAPDRTMVDMAGPAAVLPTEGRSTEADEGLIHEAKRIARLIISEIKLYNQDKIAKAKSKREVLELLKNDLIKGKQHYNTRIASKLPMGPDHFMETVKEILLAGKN